MAERKGRKVTKVPKPKRIGTKSRTGLKAARSKTKAKKSSRKKR